MTRWRWIRPWPAVGLAALALYGCTTQTVRLVDERGAAPSMGRYALASDPEAPTPTALDAAVVRRLGQLGLTRGDDHPEFRVEALYSERQGLVGAFSDLAADGKPRWVANTAQVRWWSWNRHPRIRQLTVRILDAGSGAEVYRGAAQEQGGRDAVEWDKLTTAAIVTSPVAAATAR
jgi:hypothetical protein